MFFETVSAAKLYYYENIKDIFRRPASGSRIDAQHIHCQFAGEGDDKA